MPELPEVETVRRGLEPAVLGRQIVDITLKRKDLRFAFPQRFAARLLGQTIETVGRRAKYLLLTLSGGETLIVHLGMTGRLIVEDSRGTLEPGAFYDDSLRHAAHDHVLITLSDGARIIYNDVRRFGFMDLAGAGALEQNAHMASLGVEPLGNSFNADALAKMFEGRIAPLKAALLDQRHIAGLGNIYVCEALHRAGLSPKRSAGSIAMPRLAGKRERLAGEIRAVLEEAILAGGSTLRDYVQADGTRGSFQQRFRVYDREGAPCQSDACGGTIKRIVQSGRSTFWCSRCQR
jgi:formamidopyrimidine-DNA glycosylase